jgi:hypothetical protein
MVGYYIVWGTQSGIYDGAYRLLDDAMDSYKRMEKEHPKDSWVVVQLIHSSGSKGLADEKFYANIKE